MGTVSNVLKILRYFSKTHEEKGLSEISRLTGRDKATTYRYLCELESNSFVEQDPETKGHRLGSTITDLARLSDPEASTLQILAQILEVVSEGASCWAFQYSSRTPTQFPILVFHLSVPQKKDFREISTYSSRGVCLYASQGATPIGGLHANAKGAMWDKAVSDFRADGVAPSPEERASATSLSAPIFDAVGTVSYVVTHARPKNLSKKNPLPLKPAVLLAARTGTAAIGGTPASTGSNLKPKRSYTGVAVHS